MPAPVNSRLPESCSPLAAASGVTAQFCALWWTASNPLDQELREKRCQPIESMQAITIAAHTQPNSSDIHRSAIPLQHADRTLGSSSYPSNREGCEGQSRGLRTVLFLVLIVSGAGLARVEPGPLARPRRGRFSSSLRL